MAEVLVLVLIAAAGLATTIGGIPVLAIRKLSHRTHDTILGLTAGIMLGVATIDLLLNLSDHVAGDATLAVASILIGSVTIIVLIKLIRRIPLPMPFVGNSKLMNGSTAFLLFIALVIHNAPEGLATGVGYGHGITPLGHSIAISIAFQNIPEGLLVAVAVMAETKSRRAGFGYAALSGLVEPVAGFIAFFTLALTPQALGMITGFAAGAMLAVVFLQIIPESHRHGYHVAATLALVAGFAIAAGVNILIGLT